MPLQLYLGEITTLQVLPASGYLSACVVDSVFSGFWLLSPLVTSNIMSSEVIHTGGCHCKSVRWQVEAPASVVALECNCSYCSMRGTWGFSVPSSKFKLIGDSNEFISTYSFNTHTARHTFCKVCGITSFYTPRSNPPGKAVTVVVSCVDPGTISHVEIRHFDGRNFEKSYERLAQRELK
ncbi:hypothetical protein LUZ61_009530 [Rhynchospora tenuis]|uniref:CENP-V/GFA domain-containing protein n=1 Tax=Rhynchospora tenuis TaxID=198213 RepID=A0AAD5ZXF3_9POAL|nr:hypothetical protein LUZ61_009530 [Rhynchospora tenuis]